MNKTEVVLIILFIELFLNVYAGKAQLKCLINDLWLKARQLNKLFYRNLLQNIFKYRFWTHNLFNYK